MTEERRILSENHDKIDEMRGDMREIKTHLEYIKIGLDSGSTKFSNIEKRVDDLESFADEFRGSLKTTKLWGAIILGIIALAEVVAIYLALVN